MVIIMPNASCTVFEVLFSKKDAILSFSCDDLTGHPGEVVSASWLPGGWQIEFKRDQRVHAVDFIGAPEDVLSKVARHEKMLVVGLSKGNDPSSPQISLSKEVDLPPRE